MRTAWIARLFTDHPDSVGESYAEHARTAASFGAAMIAGGLACFVHAAVPGLFTKTGSSVIRRLGARMAARRPGLRHIPEWSRGWTYDI